MNRTGVHITPDRLVGQPAPQRDCLHFGCQDGWHNPSCIALGLYRTDALLARPNDESERNGRLRGKRRAGKEDL